MRVRTKDAGQKTLVGFHVGDIHYAVDISQVVQIVRPGSVEALPHLPPAVLGLSDYRGEVIPVVDLRQRFGLPPSRGGREKWIVVRVGHRNAALVVDGVTDVVGTAGGEIKPAPSVGEGDDLRGILGIVTVREKMTFVLDLEKLQSTLDRVGDPVRGARAEGMA